MNALKVIAGDVWMLTRTFFKMCWVGCFLSIFLAHWVALFSVMVNPRTMGWHGR